MKVIFHSAVACLLLITASTSTSCKKIIDEIKKKPGGGVASDCQIDKIICRLDDGTFTDDGQLLGYEDTAQFYYNKAGYPTQIIHSYAKINPNFGINRVFKYDAKNRLVSQLFNYQRFSDRGVDFAQYWDVYEYEENRITRYTYWDASAPIGKGDAYKSITEKPTSYDADFVIITVYELDAYGRIIKSSDYYNGAIKREFQYDASGNLMGTDYIYNNKISYAQTNKVWMLLKEDFSVNVRTSPVGPYVPSEIVEEYNSRNLPSLFSEDTYPRLSATHHFDVNYIGKARMLYICK